MEEMSSAVVVPFRVGNSVCDNPNMATPMDITRLKLMTDTAGLLSDSVTKASDDPTEVGSDDCKSSNGEEEVGIATDLVTNDDKCEGVPLSVVLSQNNTNWVAADETISPGSEEDDSLSLEGDHIYDSSCSHSVISDNSSICGDDFLGSEVFSIEAFDSIGNAKDISSVDVAAKANIGESNVESLETQIASSSAVAVNLDVGDGLGAEACTGNMVLQLPLEKRASEPVGRSVFEVDCVPLWGFTSVCGRRPEMEDAVATLPRFSEIPVQMLIGSRVLDGSSKAVAHQTVHFFGVYDGHGGSQVCIQISFVK